MAKFKNGDRVKNMQTDNLHIPFGATGTVQEDDESPNVNWDEVTEYAKRNGDNFKLFWQRETFLELIQQANANDPLGIIGKKMKGFEFENRKRNEVSYNAAMGVYIGKTAYIYQYDKEWSAYLCEFEDKEKWLYPAELIMQHIIEEPQELTLLEKFEQGWEIMEPKGCKVVAAYKSKTTDKIIIEWSDGDVHAYNSDSKFEALFTCTPPKERKTLYVYQGLEQGVFASTEKYLYPIITEIHLEKTGDKWEVVNP